MGWNSAQNDVEWNILDSVGFAWLSCILSNLLSEIKQLINQFIASMNFCTSVPIMNNHKWECTTLHALKIQPVKF